MITEEETICPKCNVQFTDLNPPRLLTMCGHTFCEKCIKDLTIKKKLNSKYKITCPLDRMSIEFSSATPTCFPKNLSVLNLAKRKMENNILSPKASNIIRHKSQTFSPQDLQYTLKNQLRTSFLSTEFNYKDVQKKPFNFLDEDMNHQTCLLHQKTLQLVCVRDYQKICPSCVIFGQHKGHTVKNLHEVQQLVKKLTERLKNIQINQNKSFQKLLSKQIANKLQNMLESKKHLLHTQITNKFKDLLEEVIFIQKKTLNKLDKKIQQYKIKLQTNLHQKIILKQKYRGWEDTLAQKISILEGQNEQQKLKVTFKSDNFLEVSEKNMQLFMSLQNDLFMQSQRILDNLALSTDFQQIKRHLKQYCKFEDCSNSFLDMNLSRITQIPSQEILLDDIQDHVVSASFIKQVERIQDGCMKKTILQTPTHSYSATSTLSNSTNKLNRIKSSNKQRFFCSPIRSSSGLKSNKLLLLSNQRNSIHNLLKSKDIPSKYQSKVQTILNNTSDILDLTNGELENQKVLTLLECIKDSPTKIIKLVRNKLTDQFVIKSIPFLNNVVMLNLTRNQLTQRSVQALLNAKKEGGLKCLKSVMVSQNKIIERKNKEIFDQLKRLGVNICN